MSTPTTSATDPVGRISLPADLVRRYGLRVTRLDARALEVTAERPSGADVERELSFLTGLDVHVVVPAEGEGRPAPGGASGPSMPRVRASSRGQAPSADVPVSSFNGAPHSPLASASGPVQVVDALLRHAAGTGASDVHLEPYEGSVRVRVRRDGVLHHTANINVSQREAVVAHIKVLAALDIAEKRRPQDGRLRFEHGGRPIDVRVSTLPTAYGEKVVLRLLDRSQVILDLGEVGLAGAELETFSEAIACPHGMIVVTGPTGSGKTTTLYAALATLNREDVNVLTAEDPVEYDLPGVNQVRARPEIGFSFAEALRAFLRQDPDVIMVGEVRDRETAEIAVRAALTGHLVLTTLHTNDAATAVTRLVDMGVEPYLVAASLRLVAAQRLVRTVCPACARDVDTSDADAARLGGPASVRHRAGAGCERCAGTGYRGRSALFELMPVGEELAARIAEGADAGAIRALARAAGMRALREAGCAAVAAGITTPAEVLRATA